MDNIGLFSPNEMISNYVNLRIQRSMFPIWKLFLLGITAGFIIGMGAAVTNVATYTISDPSTVRLINGLLFPFGLAMCIILGAELFTGNCLMFIVIYKKEIALAIVLRNWIIVYLGNFIGAIILARLMVTFGTPTSFNDNLAYHMINIAHNKIDMSPINGFVSGIFCNILVCFGILCSLSSKDITGRILGAYLPVAFFVICGFEHCVANMYFIPSGIMAAKYLGVVDGYLTFINFFIKSLLPVTLGNILGGFLVSSLMYFTYSYQKERL